MAKQPFRQSDVTRAIRAAEVAGLRVGRVEITPEGGINVVVAPEAAQVELTPLQKWRAERDARRA